jgi:tryptophan synthase beta chain
VLNHVLLHQTIIGEEALLQLAKAGETPPPHRRLHRRRLELRRPDLPVPAREARRRPDEPGHPRRRAGRLPVADPQGVYAYDFGDTAGLTPLMKMHTLGHDFMPDPIHAGGLRYHGMSPLISHVYELGLIEAEAKTQTECFAAGVQFARTEGIVPAPEPTHAIAAAVARRSRPRRPARRP